MQDAPPRVRALKTSKLKNGRVMAILHGLLRSSSNRLMASAGAGTASRGASTHATVVMVELVTAAHCIETDVMDVRPLLRLMDIATCASAEKHTGVNCVTASMGDVVFDHMPTAGDLLELTATPVFAGRTSLDIGLTAMCIGEDGVRNFVCYASFTYVTTRGPDGQKRFCPPLSEELYGSDDDDSQNRSKSTTDWARTTAKFRRSLVKVEMKSASLIKNEVGVASGFETEFSEVVLPAHQNHMGHTFGGIVMGWMAKAALAEASRRSKRRIGTLLIRSVLRVEFSTGSDVSDHLIFRPRLNATFDDGQSAEIEVRVSKRCIASGRECDMNHGYFYVSGYTRGEKVDKPFGTTKAFGCSALGKEIQCRITADTNWRRRLLLARRRLLGGTGEAVEWHSSLQDEAPLLTILAVLRLVHKEDPAVKWKELCSNDESHRFPTKSIAGRASIIGAGRTNKTNISNFILEVTPGEPLGRKNTFILRGRAVILNTTVSTLFDMVKDERTQWDELCNSIKIIEEKQTGKGENEEEVNWDIVEHEALTPQAALAMGYIFCWKTLSRPKKHVPLCLIRTWQTSENDGTAVFASQSVHHPDAAKGTLTQVLPSGWFFSSFQDAVSGKTVGVSLTYVVEHDLVHLRRLAPMLKDKIIIKTMASSTERWFYNLASMAQK